MNRVILFKKEKGRLLDNGPPRAAKWFLTSFFFKVQPSPKERLVDIGRFE
jgi:hypothetical protein